MLETFLFQKKLTIPIARQTGRSKIKLGIFSSNSILLRTTNILVKVNLVLIVPMKTTDTYKIYWSSKFWYIQCQKHKPIPLEHSDKTKPGLFSTIESNQYK
jgi:hypothetical protein